MIVPTPTPAVLDQLRRDPGCEQELRERVVAEARRWLRTPYYHMTDEIGAGVDCCMLLVRSWVDSGTVLPFDPRPYPRDWHLHTREERYLEWIQQCAVEVESPSLGDIALWRFGRTFSHSAIVADSRRVIHAFQQMGECVLTERADATLLWAGSQLRPVRYFDVFARVRSLC